MSRKIPKSNRQAKRIALEVVEGIFDDPDFGSALTPYAHKRLTNAQKRTSKKTRTLTEMKAKYI